MFYGVAGKVKGVAVGDSEKTQSRRSFSNDVLDARLAAIVDSSFDAIISKDLNSIIGSWNRAAETLFGYTAEEAIGKSIRMLIPEERLNEEDDIISRIRSGTRVETYETVRMRRNRIRVPVSLTISPIRDAEGTIIGASKIARDISEAKENERRIKFLLREVNHRVKNQYAVILSIIRETAARTASPAEFEVKLRERIMAMASAHDLLVSTDWTGAKLIELVTEQLRPFQQEGLVAVSGPLLTVTPNAVQHLAMALHELATNSSKHGVLGSGRGGIEISWSVNANDEEFAICWSESFAEPSSRRNTDRTKHGFGTVILERVTPRALSGTAEIEWAKDQMRWSLRAPLRDIVAMQSVG